MVVEPWIAIFLAALAAVFQAPRWLTILLLVIGYGLAFASGQLKILACIPIALLICTGILMQWSPSLASKILCNVVFLVVAIAVFQHWLPGINNLRVIHAERFTLNAAPYTMYLNLDKPLIGFWLLLSYPWVQPKKGISILAVSALVACAITSALCLCIAFYAGSIAWAPKWPHLAWLWILNNFFLVVFAEEAFFRGYVQGGVVRLMKARPHAQWLGLILGAALFGLTHYQGGALLVLLACLAGVGAGFAYRVGGLKAAMLAHFGLNLLHFSLFTYPMLAHS